MEYGEVEIILSNLLEREEIRCRKPTPQEWEKLEQTTNCFFPKEFKFFIELMSQWTFPGDIYNVARDNNGNDLIQDIYISELENVEWRKDMIPFYGIGNGDYFCIHSINGIGKEVYYYYHDEQLFELFTFTFEEWIRQLPEFLS